MLRHCLGGSLLLHGHHVVGVGSGHFHLLRHLVEQFVVVLGGLGLGGVFEGHEEQRQGDDKPQQEPLPPPCVEIGYFRLLNFHF